jgi:transposase-like protein
MGRTPKKPKPNKARKVMTPGSYEREREQEQKRKSSGNTPNRRGRPKVSKTKKGTARKDNYRSKYTREDMDEAVRLVLEEKYSIASAAKALNSVKKNAVPRMTLNDRINTDRPTVQPKVGRPQELSPAVEEAIVKCLIMCAEFQYPMRKRDVQLLVQSYVVENNVETRWPDGKPGKQGSTIWFKNITTDVISKTLHTTFLPLLVYTVPINVQF